MGGRADREDRKVHTQKAQEVEFPATGFAFPITARDSENKRDGGGFERSGSCSCCRDGMEGVDMDNHAVVIQLALNSNNE